MPWPVAVHFRGTHDPPHAGIFKKYNSPTFVDESINSEEHLSVNGNIYINEILQMFMNRKLEFKGASLPREGTAGNPYNI